MSKPRRRDNRDDGFIGLAAVGVILGLGAIAGVLGVEVENLIKWIFFGAIGLGLMLLVLNRELAKIDPNATEEEREKARNKSRWEW